MSIIFCPQISAPLGGCFVSFCSDMQHCLRDNFFLTKTSNLLKHPVAHCRRRQAIVWPKNLVGGHSTPRQPPGWTWVRNGGPLTSFGSLGRATHLSSNATSVNAKSGAVVDVTLDRRGVPGCLDWPLCLSIEPLAYPLLAEPPPLILLTPGCLFAIEMVCGDRFHKK